jgi:hypothetical protein
MRETGESKDGCTIKRSTPEMTPPNLFSFAMFYLIGQPILAADGGA